MLIVHTYAHTQHTHTHTHTHTLRLQASGFRDGLTYICLLFTHIHTYRGVPGRAVKRPEAPWERMGAKDAGPWLDQDKYKGRRGPHTHQVLEHL